MSNIGYLKLPEYAACVTVIVVSQRDIFHSTVVPLQVLLHMFKEPRFVVIANSIDLNKYTKILSNQTNCKILRSL